MDEARSAPFGIPRDIATRVAHDCHDVAEIVTLPRVADAPAFDRSEWIHEQLKRVVQDMTVPWVVALQAECRASDACTVMHIGTDVYLCPTHDEELQCSALAYTYHALDAAAEQLQSPHHFPAHTRIPKQSQHLFGAVSKQLARVFLHIWHHHPALFRQCEAQSSLYARFYALVDMYELFPVDELPEAGTMGSSDAATGAPAHTQGPSSSTQGAHEGEKPAAAP